MRGSAKAWEPAAPLWPIVPALRNGYQVLAVAWKPRPYARCVPVIMSWPAEWIWPNSATVSCFRSGARPSTSLIVAA